MDGQMIISVGREFGSGGHVIAEALAKRFGLPLYDSNLLEHIAQEKNIDHTELKNMTRSLKQAAFQDGPGLLQLRAGKHCVYAVRLSEKKGRERRILCGGGPLC